MIGPLAPKLALARTVGALARRRGGGATSAPGKVLLRLEPDAIRALGRRLERGSVLISATNGKTTSAALAASILTGEGIALVHNRAGANMAGGIASTLLDASSERDFGAGAIGLFEVDELWLDRIVAQLHPRVIVLGNLFRDQLDRYGELDTIAERWESTLRSGAGRDARLVLNADDPLLADIGRDADGRVLYFGIDDDALAQTGMAHAADAKHCRNCGAPYVFDAIYLGHLGRYHCATCGRSRPSGEALAVRATDVQLDGVRAARFTLHTPAGTATVTLALPGLYNVYNALAAAALATVLEVPLPQIVAGLQDADAVFGRAETVMLEAPVRRELRILLVKNPVGANEVLRTLALEPGEHDLLGVLNDRIADGRDVSWIWDADYELLAGRVRRFTCSGSRAAELAVRLKYAGIEPTRIDVQPDLAAALASAGADRPDSCGADSSNPGKGAVTSASDKGAGVKYPDKGTGGSRSAGKSAGAGDSVTNDTTCAAPPLYALPTYTAMLALRELLASRSDAGASSVRGALS